MLSRIGPCHKVSQCQLMMLYIIRIYHECEEGRIEGSPFGITRLAE